MNTNSTDSIIKKPIRWWAAGLLGGLLSLMLLGVCYLISEEIVFNGFTMFITLFLPTIVATAIHTKWGQAKNHMRNSIATAMLSITFPAIATVYGIFNLIWLKGWGGWDWGIMTLIFALLLCVYIPTFCGAIIIWGLFGGSKKFGGQETMK